MTGKSTLVKRILGAGLALVMLLSLAVPALAAPTADSEYAVLIDSATGQVLFDKNMDDSISPSGLVKIMTALVAIESGTPLTNELKVTSDALEPLGSGYRSIDLSAGEEISLEGCLQGMLLQSANDAANVIAASVGGDLDTFVTKMNTKVAELGLEDTEFVNSHGLPENGQTTTAYDMAMILRYALSNPDFARIFGSQEATIPATNYTSSARELVTRCRLNRNDSDLAFDGSIGGVIGYSSETGFIIATAATRDGRTLISVVAKSQDENNLYTDATKLLEYGFEGFTQYNFGGNEFVSPEVIITSSGVKVGTAIFHAAPETVSVLLPTDADPDKVVIVAGALPSSIEKDASMDYTADICYDHGDKNYSVLIPNVLISPDVKLDSTSTEPVYSPDETSGSIATDDDGNPVTDDQGNVVTEDPNAITTTGEGGGNGGGFKKFILTLLKVLLIIIAVAAGAVLLFILSLVIIKQVKRTKKRKARARAAAERAARAQQRQQERDFFN